MEPETIISIFIMKYILSLCSVFLILCSCSKDSQPKPQQEEQEKNSISLSNLLLANKQWFSNGTNQNKQFRCIQ